MGLNRYGVALEAIDGDVFVIVRDLPEVVTAGDTIAEALELAADAITVAVAGRITDEMDLPEPTPLLPGEHPVTLAPHLAAKASVYRAWKRSGLRKTEVARRLNRSETEIRRILDPRHGTKLDHLAEAAQALGVRLVVGAEPLTPAER